MQNIDKCNIIGVPGKESAWENRIHLKERVKKGLEELIDAGNTYFVCVMNEPGVVIADGLCDLQKDHPEVRFDAIIPYEEMCASWDEDVRDCYFSAMERCEKEYIFTRHPYSGCLEKLVGKIVDSSSHVVAVIV